MARSIRRRDAVESGGEPTKNPVRAVEGAPRCWKLWAHGVVWGVAEGDWEYSRIIACQRERGHAKQCFHSSIFGDFWWWSGK